MKKDSKMTYDSVLCAVFAHKPDYDLLIDNRLKGADETHCKRCGQKLTTREVVKRNFKQFNKRLHIRLIESLNDSPYKELLRPEYRT